MTMLADEVAVRLRQLDMKCATVNITIRDPNFKDISRQKGLSSPTYLAREIIQAAMELLEQSWTSRTGHGRHPGQIRQGCHLSRSGQGEQGRGTRREIKKAGP